jgi:SAM-dependent methyltransferase
MEKTPPPGFDKPTELPENREENQEWQNHNRTWWESHPMRYDWRDQIPYPEFSKEFYLEIDKRFFSDAKNYMPWKRIPFDPLIDFPELANKKVLEIGVGNGSHAQLLAQHAASYTGIDLTDYAVKSTTKRLECFGLKASILRMDAEQLEFDDDTFDLIWSWGVIHHSANTGRILQEMRRVLKPGGAAITMVYHRNVFNYYFVSGLVRGVLMGKFFQGKSLHEILQTATDGAIARFYTVPEWEALTSKSFTTVDVCICGGKAEVFPIPGGAFKNALMNLVPNVCTRFLTNQLKFGTFLVTTLEKPLDGVSR